MEKLKDQNFVKSLNNSQTSFDLFLLLANSNSKDLTQRSVMSDSRFSCREYFYKGILIGVCRYSLKEEKFSLQNRLCFEMDFWATLKGKGAEDLSIVTKDFLLRYNNRFIFSKYALTKLGLEKDAIKDIGKYILYDMIKYSTSNGYKFFNFRSENSSLGFYNKVLPDFIKRGFIKSFYSDSNNYFKVVLNDEKKSNTQLPKNEIKTDFNLFLSLEKTRNPDFIVEEIDSGFSHKELKFFYKGNLVGACEYLDSENGNFNYKTLKANSFHFSSLATINGKVSSDMADVTKKYFLKHSNKFQASKRNFKNSFEDFDGIKDIGKYILYYAINLAKSKEYSCFTFISDSTSLDFYKKSVEYLKKRGFIKAYIIKKEGFFTVYFN